MSALVRFTEKPQRVTGVVTAPKEEYLDVLGFRSMKLQLRMIGVEAGVAPKLAVVIETSNVLDDSSFGALGYFDTLDAIDAKSIQDFGAPLRWIRWRVTYFAGMDAAWFTIEGVAFE